MTRRKCTVAKEVGRERAAERRAARKPARAVGPCDYRLGEQLASDDGARFEVVEVIPADPDRYDRDHHVVIRRCDGTGEPMRRLAERDGVLLDGWGRRARRLEQEAV
jgi:hypothetical protein